MKKISAVLLIAVLASGLVFAGFSGSATVGFGADLDKKDYGFIGNGTTVTIDYKFAEELGGAKSEGGVYAEINGTLSLQFNTAAEDPASVDTGDSHVAFVAAEITDAKIVGDNWSVSLLGAAAPKDFAKSSIDTYTTKEKGAQNVNDWGYKKAKATGNASYNLGYDGDHTTPGIEASYADYVVGVALKGNYADGAEKPDMLGYIYTPKYELADGVTVKAGVAAFKQGVLYSGTSSEKKAVGGSLEVGYASDAFSASVASDLGYNLVAEEFGVDVLAKVNYAPIAVELYYKNLATSYKYTAKVLADNLNPKYYAGKNLLSAKVVADLSDSLPLTVTLTGKDLVSAQDLDLKAEYEVVEGIKLAVNGGYQFKGVDAVTGVYADKKEWTGGLGVTYTADKFTAKVSGALTGKTEITDIEVKASVESSALIPGATLALAWDDGDQDINLKAKKYGQIVASAKVSF